MQKQTKEELEFGKRGKWITADNKLESVNFYDTFFWDGDLNSNIKINICGLGFFYLYINGKKVSDDLLVPVWTNYVERDFRTLLYPTNDKISSRINYLEYDIKPYINKGLNKVCVIVGNGWFRQNIRNVEGNNSYSNNLLLYYEILENNEVCLGYTNDDILYEENYIRANNVYFGETHDYKNYRKDILMNPSSLALKSMVIKMPNSPFYKQDCPSDKVIRTIPCKLIKVGKHYVYDVNENITGRVVIKNAKGKITVRHSEMLDENQELDFSSAGGDNQIQTVVFDNLPYDIEGYSVFSYQAFRYFDIEGECTVERIEVIHTDLNKCVSFSCSNETLNWLFNAYSRTQLDNMHSGVPSDCPHRERLGYTGDGQITCDAAMTFFDAELFYKKWIRDILDSQDIKSGHVQHTAPFYGGGGGPGGWGSAIVFVPYYHYHHYKDVSILEEALPYMEKWVNSMEEFSDGGLVTREYEKGWCLGEWCTPNHEILLKEPFVNTYFYIKALECIAEITSTLGKNSSKFLAMIEYKKKVFNDTYFDKKTGRFLESKQGADAFGLMLGLGDDRTRNYLNENYSKGIIDTGIFGTKIVGDALYQNGFFQTLFNFITSKGENSFYHMMNMGATTLFETWNGDDSLNHPMFGGISYLLSAAFAGVKMKENRIIVSPVIVDGLDYLEYKENSKRCDIAVSYKKENDKIIFNLFSKEKAFFIYNEKTYEFIGNFNKTFNLK